MFSSLLMCNYSLNHYHHSHYSRTFKSASTNSRIQSEWWGEQFCLIRNCSPSLLGMSCHWPDGQVLARNPSGCEWRVPHSLIVNLKEPRATVTSNHVGILHANCKSPSGIDMEEIGPWVLRKLPCGLLLAASWRSHSHVCGIWQTDSDPTSLASACWEYVSWTIHFRVHGPENDAWVHCISETIFL